MGEAATRKSARASPGRLSGVPGRARSTTERVRRGSGPRSRQVAAAGDGLEERLAEPATCRPPSGHAGRDDGSPDLLTTARRRPTRRPRACKGAAVTSRTPSPRAPTGFACLYASATKWIASPSSSNAWTEASPSATNDGVVEHRGHRRDRAGRPASRRRRPSVSSPVVRREDLDDGTARRAARASTTASGGGVHAVGGEHGDLAAWPAAAGLVARLSAGESRPWLPRRVAAGAGTPSGGDATRQAVVDVRRGSLDDPLPDVRPLDLAELERGTPSTMCCCLPAGSCCSRTACAWL